MYLCKLCGVREACVSSRRHPGMCRQCISSVAAREARSTPEPTEAELDALIAEQMKPENLPAWWEKEARKMQAGEAE